MRKENRRLQEQLRRIKRIYEFISGERRDEKGEEEVAGAAQEDKEEPG